MKINGIQFFTPKYNIPLNCRQNEESKSGQNIISSHLSNIPTGCCGIFFAKNVRYGGVPMTPMYSVRMRDMEIVWHESHTSCGEYINRTIGVGSEKKKNGYLACDGQYFVISASSVEDEDGKLDKELLTKKALKVYAESEKIKQEKRIPDYCLIGQDKIIKCTSKTVAEGAQVAGVTGTHIRNCIKLEGYNIAGEYVVRKLEDVTDENGNFIEEKIEEARALYKNRLRKKLSRPIAVYVLSKDDNRDEPPKYASLTEAAYSYDSFCQVVKSAKEKNKLLKKQHLVVDANNIENSDGSLNKEKAAEAYKMLDELLEKEKLKSYKRSKKAK